VLVRTFVCSVSAEDAPSLRSLQGWVAMLQKAKSLLPLLESITPTFAKSATSGNLHSLPGVSSIRDKCLSGRNGHLGEAGCTGSWCELRLEFSFLSA
jgi:hypothetical protein